MRTEHHDGGLEDPGPALRGLRRGLLDNINKSPTTATAMDDASRRSLAKSEIGSPVSPKPVAQPRGVETVQLEFDRAHVLEEAVPAETDPATLRDREFYSVVWKTDACDQCCPGGLVESAPIELKSCMRL